MRILRMNLRKVTTRLIILGDFFVWKQLLRPNPKSEVRVKTLNPNTEARPQTTFQIKLGLDSHHMSRAISKLCFKPHVYIGV